MHEVIRKDLCEIVTLEDEKEPGYEFWGPSDTRGRSSRGKCLLI